MQIASRAKIDPFYVMQMFREAEMLRASGADIIHLSLGQPSAPAPQAAMEAVAKAIKDGDLGYTDSRGLPSLREALAAHYTKQYGCNVDPARIFVTVGSSGAYVMALLAAFNPGDKIAIARPYYPASVNMMLALGLQPVILPSGSDSNYQPTVDLLKQIEPVQGLVIASPSNPAGTVIDVAELQQLAAYCEERAIRIISDEIYHGISYGGVKTASILEYSDQMIITNSFSKYYLLPGFRLGWMVMPNELVAPTEALLQNFYISPPTISQYAALAALNCRAELDTVVKGYELNRDYLIKTLVGAGITHFAAPQGAFYIYANISHLTNNSGQFCDQLLHEKHVCTVPGRDFDKEHGQRFMRLSYCGDAKAVREGAMRLADWLNARTSQPAA